MSTPLLEIRDLDIAFGRGPGAMKAASGVSFSLDAGEILSLVGESGSGKSVTALSILGLLPRQGRVRGGQILFEGRDLCALDEAGLDEVRGAGIAMIFQDIMYSLNPVLTIGTQMTEGMRRHLGLSASAARERAVALLSHTGIRDAAQVMKKYPHMLSGGMRQRVMIAMALSCRPRLLIADEPTTALDVTIQLQIMRMLRALRDETGMGILLITHDIGVVAETADRVVVMYAGQCVEEAPVAELLTRPAHAYTRALIPSVPGIHDARSVRLSAIGGSVPETYGEMTGCRFAPRCRWAQACGMTERAAMREIAPGHFSRCDYRGDGSEGGDGYAG